MSCPLCGSRGVKVIGKPETNSISKNIVDKDYEIVQCTQCTVYYVSPGIGFSDEQWSLLYNSEYFGSNSKWLDKKRAQELSQRLDKAEKYINKMDNIHLLDVGTGEGRTLVEGRKRNWNVTGIDIVDNRNAEAKAGDINFIKGKFLDYNFAPDSFDFIYLDSVLEHVLNPLQYLEKIQKLLKPGGIVYVGVPNEDSLFNDVRRAAFNLTGKKNVSVKIKPFASPYHVIGFNNNSLQLIIKKANLEIKEFRNFGRKMEFLSSPFASKDFWISFFFLFPVEMIGNLLKRDVYFEVYLTKT